MAQSSRSGHGRVVGLFGAGMLVGAMIVSPAGAHVTRSVKHLIGKHLTKAFYTQAQADAAFLTPAEGDARYRLNGCGSDPNQVMVQVGPTCIDRYEASVWSSPTGGVQHGVSGDDYPCDDNGEDCAGVIYARSVPGVTPSRFITWFQAQQALANSGKRLPTNAEWQTAVAGTPDSITCEINGFSVANTGSRPGCVSNWGANDMVGNLWEWVADWDEQADDCTVWEADYGSDFACFGDPTPSRFPGALIRGGDYDDVSNAGSFAVYVLGRPSNSNGFLGFRGAR